MLRLTAKGSMLSSSSCSEVEWVLGVAVADGQHRLIPVFVAASAVCIVPFFGALGDCAWRRQLTCDRRILMLCVMSIVNTSSYKHATLTL